MCCFLRRPPFYDVRDTESVTPCGFAVGYLTYPSTLPQILGKQGRIAPAYHLLCFEALFPWEKIWKYQKYSENRIPYDYTGINSYYPIQFHRKQSLIEYPECFGPTPLVSNGEKFPKHTFAKGCNHDGWSETNPLRKGRIFGYLIIWS